MTGDLDLSFDGRADHLLGVFRLAFQPPPTRHLGRHAQGVAAHEHEDDGHRLIGLRADEPALLVDREGVIVIASLACTLELMRSHRLYRPRVSGEHRERVFGHGQSGRSPVDRVHVGELDLRPHLVAGERDELSLLPTCQ